MSPSPPTTVSLARRSAVLTGLGFASGFGWLWFPALQDWWLPLFLWGTPWSGGGVSLFYLLLAAGFFGCTLYGRYFGKTANGSASASCTGNGTADVMPQETATTDFRLTRLSHWVHGLTFALIAIAMAPPLFAPLRLSGAWLYPPVVCMAMAGLIQGVFWTGAMLSLPARSAVGAYAVALCSAALFSGVCSLVGGSTRVLLLFVGILAAWQAAQALRRTLLTPLPEPKRARGRPPKPSQGASQYAGLSPKGLHSSGALLFACAVLFFLLACGQAVLGGSTEVIMPTLPAWIACLLPFLGAVAVFLTVTTERELRRKEFSTEQESEEETSTLERISRLLPEAKFSPFVTLTCLTALWGLALLSGSWTYPAWVTGYTLDGCVCALALIPLTAGLQSGNGHPSHPPGKVWSRASFTLGAALVVAILGTAVGQGLSLLGEALTKAVFEESGTGSIGMALSPQALAGILALLAACAFFILLRKGAVSEKTPVPAAPEEDDPEAAITLGPEEPPATDEPSGPVFTGRELEILNLLHQGKNNRQIAAHLDIQEGTVRFHLRNMYQKTGVREREELAALVEIKNDTEQ